MLLCSLHHVLHHGNFNAPHHLQHVFYFKLDVQIVQTAELLHPFNHWVSQY